MSEHLVELPAGGHMGLQSAEEEAMWNTSAEKYLDDYGFTRQNDLTLLGAILTQQLVMFRAQRRIADPEDKTPAESQNRMLKAAAEIRDLEKALGIDKKTREAGGTHNVAEYITRLKRAAHSKGVRISDRVKEIESLMMDMSWQIRLLRNGDDEDRRHHGITEGSIVNELERRIDEIHERDKEWAREKGALFVGTL